MTQEQINEIKTYLDAIDFALEEIRGAQKTIRENREWIYEILNSNLNEHGVDVTQPH